MEIIHSAGILYFNWLKTLLNIHDTRLMFRCGISVCFLATARLVTPKSYFTKRFFFIFKMLVSYFAILLLLSNKFTVALKLDCHREDKFIETSQDGLPLVSAIHVTTALTCAFCTIECLDHDGCQSVVFHTSKSENNCQFSSEVNGASSNEPSTITYVKENSTEKMCDGAPCQNGGSCTDMCVKPYYSCECTQYSDGKNCEFSWICNAAPCQNGGTCSVHSGSPYYQCQCPSTHSGTDCEINIVCNTPPCQNGGTCSTISSSPYYQCTCPATHSGTDCETNVACGLSPCHNGGTCSTVPSPPYYQCSCPATHSGTECQTNIVCNTPPCENGGTCSTISSSPYYQCTCPAPYSGTDCEINLDCETSYTTDSDGTRYHLYSGAGACDSLDYNGFTAGWYRFTGSAGSQLITSCPSYSEYRCDTIAQGYLTGGHPPVSMGKVSRTVCFCYNNSPCAFSTAITVQNCGSYYLYYLPMTPGCHLRYCTY